MVDFLTAEAKYMSAIRESQAQESGHSLCQSWHVAYMVKNHMFHPQTEYIGIEYHFVLN